MSIDTKNTLEMQNKYSISIDNIGKRFNYLWAVKGIDIHIDQENIVGFIGPNGAGKSTLLNLLGTIIAPTKGTIKIFGQNIFQKSEIMRKQIILFSYHSFLYDELSGLENLEFWCKLYELVKPNNYSSLKQYISEKAKEFGIGNWLERPVRELSTGMRKKIDFLRILLINPKIILLDEPFSGMDTKNISIFVEALFSLRKDSIILIASHNLDLMANLCDKIYVLQKGRIIRTLDSNSISKDVLHKIIQEA